MLALAASLPLGIPPRLTRQCTFFGGDLEDSGNFYTGLANGGDAVMASELDPFSTLTGSDGRAWVSHFAELAYCGEHDAKADTLGGRNYAWWGAQTCIVDSMQGSCQTKISHNFLGVELFSINDQVLYFNATGTFDDTKEQIVVIAPPHGYLVSSANAGELDVIFTDEYIEAVAHAVYLLQNKMNSAGIDPLVVVALPPPLKVTNPLSNWYRNDMRDFFGQMTPKVFLHESGGEAVTYSNIESSDLNDAIRNRLSVEGQPDSLAFPNRVVYVDLNQIMTDHIFNATDYRMADANATLGQFNAASLCWENCWMTQVCPPLEGEHNATCTYPGGECTVHKPASCDTELWVTAHTLTDRGARLLATHAVDFLRSTTSLLRGDPHLRFAHGGRADFRGVNGTTYVLLSAANLSLSATTMDHEFLLPGNTKTSMKWVNGSFFTRFFLTVRLASGALRHVRLDADRTGYVMLDGARRVIDNRDNRTWKLHKEENLRVWTKVISTTIYAQGWKVVATSNPIYFRIAGPYRNRFDLSLAPLDGTELAEEYGSARLGLVAPHGIIGQSYDGDGLALDGKRDDYDPPLASPHDVVRIQTTAMAEGAIEGRAADYALGADPFETAFRFSRFDAARAAPRDVSATMAKRLGKGSASSLSGTEEGVEVK